MEYILVGLGGMFGAVSRYGLSRLIYRRWNGGFPLATFVINITGSFILGLIYYLIQNTAVALPVLRNLFAMGFLGAYTTYSTFSYEVIVLLEEKDNRTAFKYIVSSVLFGLLAAFAGLLMGPVLLASF